MTDETTRVRLARPTYMTVRKLAFDNGKTIQATVESLIQKGLGK